MSHALASKGKGKGKSKGKGKLSSLSIPPPPGLTLDYATCYDTLHTIHADDFAGKLEAVQASLTKTFSPPVRLGARAMENPPRAKERTKARTSPPRENLPRGRASAKAKVRAKAGRVVVGEVAAFAIDPQTRP